MKTLYDIFLIIDEFTEYLKNKGFCFSKEGYPIFTEEMFLKDFPEEMVPVFQRKNKIVKKEATAICFFCGDKHIYRRLKSLLSEIEEYKQYMGVVEPDISVTPDMDIEWQKVIMLLNQLVMAVFAVNGIKIILNTRVGAAETRVLFKNVPKNILVASGFRGCNKKQKEINYDYISKIVQMLPRGVLIYGACSKAVQEQLKIMGINYKTYKDFRSLCKEVS